MKPGEHVAHLVVRYADDHEKFEHFDRSTYQIPGFLLIPSLNVLPAEDGDLLNLPLKNSRVKCSL